MERFRIEFSLNPANFYGCQSLSLFPVNETCTKPWPKYSWQYDGNASHEDLKGTLLNAERTVAKWLGYNCMPRWEEIELIQPRYLGFFATNGRDVSGRLAGLDAGRGHVIAGGVRGVTEIELEAPLAYTHKRTVAGGANPPPTDWATVTITKPTPAPNSQEVRIFYPGMGGDPRWEIPAALVSETDTEWIFGMDRWVLVSDDEREKFPGRSGYSPINFDADSNFIEEVDVYHVYNDSTLPTATLIWEGDGPCNDAGVCEDLEQPACIQIRDHKTGIVLLEPVRFIPAEEPVDENDGEWVRAEYSQRRAPDRVVLNLYSGKVSNEYIAGYERDPLDSTLSRAICDLTVARMDREICECGNKRVIELREDMAFSSKQGNFLAIADQIQTAPFGAKKGEYYAYLTMKDSFRRYSVAVL